MLRCFSILDDGYRHRAKEPADGIRLKLSSTVSLAMQGGQSGAAFSADDAEALPPVTDFQYDFSLEYQVLQ
eukprot:SAG31_NODE_7548_length_1658_cov_1.973701_2_plen_71_part_00